MPGRHSTGVHGGGTPLESAAPRTGRTGVAGAGGGTGEKESLTEVDLLLAAGTLGHGVSSARLRSSFARAVGCSAPAPQESLLGGSSPPRPDVRPRPQLESPPGAASPGSAPLTSCSLCILHPSNATALHCLPPCTPTS